jgi:hypothetical protein
VAPRTKTGTKPRTVRQDLGAAITEVFDADWLRGFAETIKTMTHGVWGEGVCDSCGSKRKVMVKVPDTQGQLKAVVELLEQAEGRPGTASGEPGGVTLVVERMWPVARDQDSADV